MYQELDLPPAEILVCLFLRGEGEAADQLAVTDFERRPEIHEGGISFFRKAQFSYKKMVERVGRKPKKRRGIATITVGQLQELGFRVFGDLKKDPTHVCVHCAECNGVESDCAPKLANCPFLRPTGQPPAEDEHVLRTRLARTMKILFDATVTKEELLSIFSKDVDDTNPVAANVQYEKRLDEYRSSKARSMPLDFPVESRPSVSAWETTNLFGEESPLDQIVRSFFEGKLRVSETLDLAMPLLQGKVLDGEYQWLVNEHDGYAIAAGDLTFEHGLPTHIAPYRIVYVDAISLRDPNGKDNHLKGWPLGENRLQILPYSISNLEERLQEKDGDYIYPPCTLNIPDVPQGFEARLVIHKSQVYRILERFKQEFIQLAGRTALGAGL